MWPALVNCLRFLFFFLLQKTGFRGVIWAPRNGQEIRDRACFTLVTRAPRMPRVELLGGVLHSVPRCRQRKKPAARRLLSVSGRRIACAALANPLARGVANFLRRRRLV